MLTLDQIGEFIRIKMPLNALSPNQPRVSLKNIQNNMILLSENQEAPAISVWNNIISNGHHRYIAGLIYGKLPMFTMAAKPSIINETTWAEIQFDYEAWA